MTATCDSEAILFGSSDGILSMWHTHTLSPCTSFPVLKLHAESQRNSSSAVKATTTQNGNNKECLNNSSHLTILPLEEGSLLPSTSITSILLTDNEQVILAGTGDGRLVVLIDSSQQSEEMIKKQLDALLI